MRYFFKEAAGAPLRVAGDYVHFEPVGNCGGSVQGVLQASPEIATEIEKIAARFGIQEITAEEFNDLVAGRRNAVYGRAVDAMANLAQAPEEPKPKKSAPLKDDPRSIVKMGKA